MEEKIKTLGELYTKHFSASLDSVRLRTGSASERIKIHHPEVAAIVPFIDSRTVVMVRQWRYAIDRETLEIPAGKADEGELLEVCARRELLEETGYGGGRFIPIFQYFPAIGYSDEVIRIFAAARLAPPGERLDTHEISKVEILRVEEIDELIVKGVIQDGKTIIGLSLFRAKALKGEIPADFFG
jgi:ADP-ribose pyrophosphatase